MNIDDKISQRAAQVELERGLPMPLNLDWDSPEGKAHHARMCALKWDHPDALAHFKNIGQHHPATLQASFTAKRSQAL